MVQSIDYEQCKMACFIISYYINYYCQVLSCGLFTLTTFQFTSNLEQLIFFRGYQARLFPEGRNIVVLFYTSYAYFVVCVCLCDNTVFTSFVLLKSPSMTESCSLRLAFPIYDLNSRES